MPGGAQTLNHSVQDRSSAANGGEVKKRKKSKSGKQKLKRKLDETEAGVESTGSIVRPSETASSPGKPSKRLLNATADASNQQVDRKPTASSNKQHSKETDKHKKNKKKRRKSEHHEEESAAKPKHSSTKARESAHDRNAKKRDVPRQNTPDTTGVVQISSPDNGSPSEQKEPPSSQAIDEHPEKQEDDEEPLDDERLPRTLFVGNVAHTVTRRQLRKMFSEYSPIESIRIRNVIPVNPKIPKKAALLAGRLAKFSDSFSAYVVFKPTADLENILQRAVDGTNMTIVEDHHLRVTKALQTKGKRRQSVFVGNLPFDCRDEELITAFMPVAKECGVNLTNVRVNRDSDTGVGRGCGFVTFDDIMGIQACLNKAGEIKVRNRVVRLERAFKTKNMKSKSYKRKWKTAFGSGDQ